MEKKKIRLEDLPKKDAFRAPDGYFDSLSSRLNDRIERSDVQSRVRILSIWKPLAIAASLIGILCVVWFGYRSAESSNAETLLTQVSIEDLQTYLGADDVEIEDVVMLADDELFVETDLLPDAVESLNNEQLENLYNEFETLKEDTL